jgi:hypothetical protein
VAVGSGAVVAAQDAPMPKDEPVHTLHVYTNLIQIPTLVLGPNRERLKTPCGEQVFDQHRLGTLVSRHPCSSGGGRPDCVFDFAGCQWGCGGVDAEDRGCDR